MARKENKTLRNEKKPTSSAINIKKGGKVVKKQLESKTRTKTSNNAKCPKCSKSLLNFNKGKSGICSSCLKNDINSSSKSYKSVIQGKSLISTPKISTDESSRRSNRIKNPEAKSNATKLNVKTRSPAISTQLDSPKPKANSTRNTRNVPKEKVVKKSLSGAKRQTSTNTTKTGVKQQLETTTRKSGNQMNLRGKKRSYTQLASGIETDNAIPMKKNRSTNKEVETRGSRSKKPTVKGSEWINKIQSKKSTVSKDESPKKENVKSPLKIKSPKMKVIQKKEKKNMPVKTPQSNTAYIKSTPKRDHIIKQKGNVRGLPKRQINKSISLAKQKDIQTVSASKKLVKQVLTPKIASSPNVLQRTRSNITAKQPVKVQGNASTSQITNKKHQIPKNNLAKSIQKKFSSFTNKNKLAQTDLKDNVVVAQGILQDIINSVGNFVDDRSPSKSKNTVQTEMSNALELNIIKTLHVENSDISGDEIETTCKTDSPSDENKEDIKLAQTSTINVDSTSSNLTSSNESETHLNAAYSKTDNKPLNSLTKAEDEINLVNNSFQVSVEMSLNKSSSPSENHQASSNNNLIFSNEIDTELDHEKHVTEIDNKDNFISTSVQGAKNYNHASVSVEDSVNNSLNIKEDTTAASLCAFNMKEDKNDVSGDNSDIQNRNEDSVVKSTSTDTGSELKTIISENNTSENMSIEISTSPTKTTPEVKQDCHESKEIYFFNITKSLNNDIKEKTKPILLQNIDKERGIPVEEKISNKIINDCLDENNAYLKKEEDISPQSIETKILNSSPNKPIARNDSSGEEILKSHNVIEASSIAKGNNLICVEYSRNENCLNTCEVTSSVEENPVPMKNESITTSINDRCIVEPSDKIVPEKGNISGKENAVDSLSSQNVSSANEEEISCNTCISNKENNTSIEENITKQIESDCGKEDNDAVILEQDRSSSQSIGIQEANSVEEKTLNNISDSLECKNNIVSTEDSSLVLHEEENILIVTDSENLSNEKPASTCVEESITIISKQTDNCPKEMNVKISVEPNSCKRSIIKEEDDSFVEKEVLNSEKSNIGGENDNKLTLRTAECSLIIPSNEETLLMETSTADNTSKDVSSTLEEKLVQSTAIEASTIKENDDSILSKECVSHRSQPINPYTNESTIVVDETNVASIDEFKNVDNTNLDGYNATPLHSKNEPTIVISSTQTIIVNEVKSKLVEVASPPITEIDCAKEENNSLGDKSDSVTTAQLNYSLVEENKYDKQKTDNNGISQNCNTINNPNKEHLLLEPENMISEEIVSSGENILSSTVIENKDNSVLGKSGNVIVQTDEGNVSNSSSKLECLGKETCMSQKPIVQDIAILVENTTDNKMVNVSNTLDVITDKESSENDDGKNMPDTNVRGNKNIASYMVEQSQSHIETIYDDKTDKENSTCVIENIPNTSTTYEINSTNDLRGKESDVTIQRDMENESVLNDKNSQKENPFSNNTYDRPERNEKADCATVKDDIDDHIENPLKELNVSATTPDQENKNKCTLNDDRKIFEENMLSNNIINDTEKNGNTDSITVENETSEHIQHHCHELQASPNARLQEMNSEDDSYLQLKEESTNTNLSIVEEKLTDLSADIRCSGQKKLFLRTNTSFCEEENAISVDNTNVKTHVEDSNCNNMVDDTQVEKPENITSVEYNINDQVQNSPEKIKISSNVEYQESDSNNKNEGSCTMLKEEDISLTLSLDEEECTNITGDGKCGEIQDSRSENNTDSICEEESPVCNITVEDKKESKINESLIDIDDAELKEGSCDDLSIKDNMEVDNVQREVLHATTNSLSVLDEKLTGCSEKTSDNVDERSQLGKSNIGSCNIGPNSELKSSVIILDDISASCKENTNLQYSTNVNKLPVADLNKCQISFSTQIVEESSLNVIQDSKKDYDNHMQLENNDANNDCGNCDSTVQNSLEESALVINDCKLVSSGELVKEETDVENRNNLNNCHYASGTKQNSEFIISHNDNSSCVKLTETEEKIDSENTNADDTVISHKSISSSSDIICIGNKSPAVCNLQEDMKVVDEGEHLPPRVEENIENNEKLEVSNVNSNCVGDEYDKCGRIVIGNVTSNNNPPRLVNVNASLDDNDSPLDDNDAPLNDNNASLNDNNASLNDNNVPLNDNNAPLNNRDAHSNDNAASFNDNVAPLSKIDVFIAANNESNSTSDQAAVKNIEREHQSFSIINHCNKNEMNLKHSENVIGEIIVDHGTEQPHSIIAERNSSITNVENICLNQQHDNTIVTETEKCKYDDVKEKFKSDSPKCASGDLISLENNSTSIGECSSEMEVVEVDSSQQNPEMHEVQMEEATLMEVDCVDSIDSTHSLPLPDSKANGQMSMEVS